MEACVAVARSPMLQYLCVFSYSYRGQARVGSETLSYRYR